MSYLQLLAGVPNFSKAVFSLWFRVPRESVIAVSEQRGVAAGAEGFFYMQSILPLLTYGKPQTNRNYQGVTTDVAVWHYHYHVPHYEISSYSEHEPYDVDPSFIGLLCNGDGTFRLAFNIQMGNEATFGSTDWITTQMDFYPPEDHPGPPVAGDGWVNTGLSWARATKKEVSYIQNAQPEWFSVETDHLLEPDQWHHVLLSFDVSGAVSIGQPFAASSSQLWYAIDDVDYRGSENLQPFRDADDGLGPNTIVTQGAYRHSSADPSLLYQNQAIAAPSGGYLPDPIPTEGYALGIPAAAKYVDAIFRVEMAEFQLFTGLTLDTGVTANRRVFVGADGKPVEPKGTKDEPRWPAEIRLGKKPEVLLHGSSNWKIGYNTGTTGVLRETQTDGTEKITKLPAGQFQPFGGIEKYKPEPRLGESPTA